MRYVSVQVDDELLLGVKQRALVSGVTLTEVVQRLLLAYVDGKFRVDALTEGEGAGPSEAVLGGFDSQPRGSSSVSAGGADGSKTVESSPVLAAENDTRQGSRGPAVGNTRPSRAAGAPCSRLVYHRKGEFCKECGYQ